MLSVPCPWKYVGYSLLEISQHFPNEVCCGRQFPAVLSIRWWLQPRETLQMTWFGLSWRAFYIIFKGALTFALNLTLPWSWQRPPWWWWTWAISSQPSASWVWCNGRTGKNTRASATSSCASTLKTSGRCVARAWKSFQICQFSSPPRHRSQHKTLPDKIMWQDWRASCQAFRPWLQRKTFTDWTYWRMSCQAFRRCASSPLLMPVQLTRWNSWPHCPRLWKLWVPGRINGCNGRDGAHQLFIVPGECIPTAFRYVQPIGIGRKFYWTYSHQIKGELPLSLANCG